MSAGDVLRRHGLPVAALAALLASFLLEPAKVAHGPVLCPLRRATGLPCPGCGLTRSFVATAHGQLAEAFTLHLFGPFLFLTCAAGAVIAFAQVRGQRAWPRPGWWKPAVGPLLSTWLVWALWRVIQLPG
ncbi:MAG: DUF2752 domain-containing protein [Planctomycetota bacterium]|nr:MAG: DUF2752 domain-containing protein [Planctomycetota bacterium]